MTKPRDFSLVDGKCTHAPRATTDKVRAHGWQWLSMQAGDTGGTEAGSMSFKVVTGWGKRSRVKGTSMVREAVGELLQQLDSPFAEPANNPGCLVAGGDAVRAWLRCVPWHADGGFAHLDTGTAGREARRLYAE